VRRAKIVCTLGPASSSVESILELIVSGMDVARLNLSHGTHADHEAAYRAVRAAGDQLGRGVGIIADLQGPKIRLGTFADGGVVLVAGAEFTITTEDVVGTVDICSTTYDGLPADVALGDLILVDDGRIVLDVLSVDGPRVRTRVVEGGRASNHKGLNLPGIALSTPALTDKDVEDLRWALNIGVDMVALSFVRSAHDFVDVYRIMDEVGVRVPVLAKIEKPQAVDHLSEIIDTFDGIMIARGDLGVELPLEQVPLVQKRAINLARAAAKPVIVATQMLDSMVSASRPTRAEVSDVANAVLDGTDALMLSAETSVGVHPAFVVTTMSRIIEEIESRALDQLPALVEDDAGSTARALAAAAVTVAHRINAENLVAFTETGFSGRLIARHRSEVPLLAFTPNPSVRSQLALSWGTETFLVSPADHTDDMVRQVDRQLLDIGRRVEGDRVVIVAGVPPGISGTTNGMRVHRIGSD